MKSLFNRKFVLTLLLLCGGLCLQVSAFAQLQIKEHETQLQVTLNQLLGVQEAERYQQIIAGDESLSYQVYLPNNSQDELPGLFVYVSPTTSGQIDRRWRAVMDQQNLIYIAADHSGNRKPVNRRMVLATLAVTAAGQKYSFNSDRIMISGFSGGGRVASMLASQYPDAFTAALYICGVNFWKKSQNANVERLIQNRFVFLTGSKDFNRDETRSIHRRYLKAGALHSKLMIIRNTSHELPSAKVLTQALDFLNGHE